MKEKEENEKEIYNLFYEQRNEEICSSTFMDSNKERNIIRKEKVYLGKKVLRKDNVRSKILNHFMNFIILFLNEYTHKIYSCQKVYFTKIDYSERKKVNVESIKKLMDLTIEQLCQLKTSKKYSIYDEKNNHECLEIIRKDLKEEFINMKISDFYQNYYLCEDEEYLKNKFGISLNTKNFKYLLEEFNENYYEKKLHEETGKNLITQFINKKSNKKKKNNKKNKNNI
jgi:hypothetical protein